MKVFVIYNGNFPTIWNFFYSLQPSCFHLTECDIRSCLNTLQFLNKKNETLNVVRILMCVSKLVVNLNRAAMVKTVGLELAIFNIYIYIYILVWVGCADWRHRLPVERNIILLEMPDMETGKTGQIFCCTIIRLV